MLLLIISLYWLHLEAIESVRCTTFHLPSLWWCVASSTGFLASVCLYISLEFLVIFLGSLAGVNGSLNIFVFPLYPFPFILIHSLASLRPQISAVICLSNFMLPEKEDKTLRSALHMRIHENWFRWTFPHLTSQCNLQVMVNKNI